ncbi:Serine/threonine-protein kinase B [Legionella steigerwaltii]|uniref:Serine/threonine-protein kinase B n=1 Tax=Legionella steigerwaltii TaxID=460 RepID=A0A378L715_9GAMM|nr:pentapeptide repeat-containing protein [Legionella steigerwaltii]KTD80663.1 Serine/threonine-protein kinase B [Legionella steigerwaltii]STY22497.1 Serine/threonine-protein kinase B [Legionella steigerwaltii]
MKDKQDRSRQEQMTLIRVEPSHDVDENNASMKQTNTEEHEENINESNPFFTLPDEMMMYILGQVPPQDLLNARLMAKSKTGVVDATLDLLTKPRFIIDYLNRVDGISGHQFTAFYQKTQRYQELKRKVLENKPLTSEEAICYTLTRDCIALPAQLKQTMEEIALDENMREHLNLIITLAEKVIEFKAIHEDWLQHGFSSTFANSILNSVKTKLWDHLKQYHHHPHQFVNLLAGVDLSGLKLHHPHQFVNLLAGVDLSGLKLTDMDFSHLNLRGVKFSECDLTGADFTGACLEGADFTGALLSGVVFTDAEVRGMQLNKAKLDGVDLSKTNLEGIDFEWALIHNARLLPVSALNSPEELNDALAQFEKSITKHSSESRRKLQEHILMEIAHQLEISTDHSKKEKITLLDIALSKIKPDDRAIYIFPFQNACLDLKEKMDSFKHKKRIPEHPLKKEAQKIIKRIMDIFNGKNLDALRKIKYAKNHIEIEIDSDVYKKEFKLLLKCIRKYPELNDSLKVTKALGISLELWHMFYLVHPEPPSSLPPILVDYEREKQQTSEGKKYYASEVFNGHMFAIEKLQKIQLKDLDQHLYEEEDFVIIQDNGRTESRVKLGDLFITFSPGGKGSVFSNIEIIDFEKRQLKPAFSVDLSRYGQVPFEAFVPLNPYVNYSAATFPGQHLTLEDVKNFQEAYRVKKQIIERILASEKINRNRKNNLFFSIFEQHEEQETNQLAALPVELLDKVCAYVHFSTFNKRERTASPLVEVSKLHGLFFAEKINQEQAKNQNGAPSCSAKGKEKKVSGKENQQPKSLKRAVAKKQGLFSASQKEVAKKSSLPVEPAENHKITSNQGLRMFPEEQRVESKTKKENGKKLRAKRIIIEEKCSRRCLIS